MPVNLYLFTKKSLCKTNHYDERFIVGETRPKLQEDHFNGFVR